MPAAEWAFLAGRVLFGAVLAWWGLMHLTRERETLLQFARRRGLPGAAGFAVAAQVLLIAGGLAVAAGIYGRWAAAVLAAQFVVMALVMHNYWAETDKVRPVARERFRKNMLVAGLLVALAAWPEPWPLALVP